MQALLELLDVQAPVARRATERRRRALAVGIGGAQLRQRAMLMVIHGLRVKHAQTKLSPVRAVSSIGRARDFGTERQSGDRWFVGSCLLGPPESLRYPSR
jgi:hypothetical protein